MRYLGARGARRAGVWTRRLAPGTWGVQVRSTIAAIGVMAVALALVAGGLLLLLRSSLESSADTAAATRADQIAAQLHTDLPTSQDVSLVSTAGETPSVVQVLDTGDRVVISSQGAPPEPLSATLPDGTTASSGSIDVPGLQGDYRISSRGVLGPGGPLTVVVAVGNRPIRETLITVAALLGVGFPLIVIVVGAATYWLIGRSLRTVERMRARVDAITTADLAARLPVPRPNDEITRLAVTLNAMLARLQAGHDAQRRFVGDASHELRSPLATVTAALELAQDQPAAIDRTVVRHNLLPEARRMERLVDDLLLLARADEQGLPLRVGDVDVDDIAGHEMGRLRHDTDLAVRADIAPARVCGDATQLARVARNLVDNAARHATSQVTITCRAAGSSVQLAVADDGPGIPAQERERVFERFVRLDTDRSRARGGSGLGLAIVAEIVRAHSGDIEVDDTPGGGARFTVTLPGPATEAAPESATDR